MVNLNDILNKRLFILIIIQIIILFLKIFRQRAIIAVVWLYCRILHIRISKIITLYIWQITFRIHILLFIYYNVRLHIVFNEISCCLCPFNSWTFLLNVDPSFQMYQLPISLARFTILSILRSLGLLTSINFKFAFLGLNRFLVREHFSLSIYLVRLLNVDTFMLRSVLSPLTDIWEFGLHVRFITVTDWCLLGWSYSRKRWLRGERRLRDVYVGRDFPCRYLFRFMMLWLLLRYRIVIFDFFWHLGLFFRFASFGSLSL